MRFLAMPHGSNLAHVTRPLEVALALRSRGHEVMFAGRGDFLQLVREQGFSVYDVLSLDREETLRATRRGHERLVHG